MKKFLSIFILLLISALSFSQSTFDPEALLKPQTGTQQLVNDFTNTLTPDQKQALENKLVAFNDSTSTQIAVVIIPTLNGNDIADYNVKLGRAWGVGGKQYSNRNFFHDFYLIKIEFKKEPIQQNKWATLLWRQRASRLLRIRNGFLYIAIGFFSFPSYLFAETFCFLLLAPNQLPDFFLHFASEVFYISFNLFFVHYPAPLFKLIGHPADNGE